MIKGFSDKATEDVFHGLFNTKAARSLPWTVHRRSRLLLEIMDSTSKLNDLKVSPGNQLKQLKGKRKGEWSVRINDQWRITFFFNGGEFSNVKIEDYH